MGQDSTLTRTGSTGREQALAPSVQVVVQAGDSPWSREVERVLESCTGRRCWRLELEGQAPGRELEVIKAVRRTQETTSKGGGPTLVVVRASSGLLERHHDQVHLLPQPDQVDQAALATAVTALEHPGRAHLVSFTGSCGALGASTLVVMVAKALRRQGLAVAVADLDPTGSLGLLLGDAPLPGLRWADLDPEEKAFLPWRLVPALPAWHGVTVLTGDCRGGPAGPGAAQAAVSALAAAHDVVLLDLPRGQAPPPGCLAVLVTGLELRLASAAEALSRRLPPATARDLRLVVRKGGLDVDLDELERMTGGRVLGLVGKDRQVSGRAARGEDPSTGKGRLVRDTSRIAQRLAQELGVG